MPLVLSASTRLLTAGLLGMALLFQIGFATTRLIGYHYAHNGRFAVQDEDWASAAWFYGHANNWFPYNHHWSYAQGVAEHNLGNTETAISALDSSNTQSPTFLPTLTRVSGIMIEYGQQPIATALNTRAMSLAPNYWEPIYLEGLAALTLSDWEKATHYLQLADQQSLDARPLTLGFLAQAAFKSGRVDLAAAAIDRAVAADDTNARHWMLGGSIHLANGNFEKSSVALERAASLFTIETVDTGALAFEIATVHARLGQVYAAQNKTDRMMRSYYEAAKHYADLRPHSAGLSKIHESLTTSLHARATDEQLKWACILAAAGLFDAAKAEFEYLDSETESWTPMSHYSYAMTLRRTGDYDAALARFRAMDAPELIPARAYAETLYEAGKPVAARFEYAKIPTMFALTEMQRAEIELRLIEIGQSQ